MNAATQTPRPVRHLQMSETQARVLSHPFGLNMNDRGGRGSGKSSTAIFRTARCRSCLATRSSAG